MGLLPQIVELHSRPALSAHGDGLLIGVELENGRIAWGECCPLPDTRAAVEIVQQQIRPILAGQSLSALPALITQIGELQEERTVTHIIPPAATPSASGSTISRRRLITGFMATDKPQTKQVVEKRPLPTPLRFGLSQALFHAYAAESNQSLPSLLTNLYALPGSRQAIPLHVAATETNIRLVSSLLSTQVASLGYSTGSSNHKTTLGANAEKLQAHVRQVNTWIASVAPQANPAIHLNIQGGFTDLYDNNEGKILGALHGLEQAAKPYAVVMENVAAGEATAVAKTLRKLQSYLGVRKMSVRLAAGSSLFSPEDLRLLVEKKAVHQIHLDAGRFGSIPQIVAFIRLCREKNINVILGCAAGVVETAVTIALATRVKAISGPPHMIYNQMMKQGSRGAGEQGSRGAEGQR